MQIKKTFHKVLSHFIFQVLCLIGISFVSRYKVPDLSETNWDTALFLTPIGLLRNFLDSSPVMRSFYADVSAGQIELAFWQMLIIAILLIIQIYNFTLLIKTINE